MSILRGLSVLLLALAAFASGVAAQNSPETPAPAAPDKVNAETVPGSAQPADKPKPDESEAKQPDNPKAESSGATPTGPESKDSKGAPEGENDTTGTKQPPKDSNDWRDKTFVFETPEQQAKAVTPVEPPSKDGWSAIQDVLIGLVLLSGILIAVVWYLKRSPRTRKFFGSGPIRILSRAHLGPRQTLYLVKAGERVLLLGQANDGLRTLMEVSDPGEVTRTLAMVEENAPDSMTTTFRAALASATSRGDKSPAEAASGISGRATGPRKPDAPTVDARVGDDPDVIRVDPSYSTQLKLAALRNQLDQPKAKVP